MDAQATQDIDQPLDQAAEGVWLPIAEAATHLGLSAKTVRRRLKAGDLLSRQVTTQHGLAYEVWVDEAVRGNGHVGRVATSSSQTGTQQPDETTLELVRLVDRIQRENRDLAGMVGSLQARLGFAEDRIRALEAPKEPHSPEIALQRDSDAVRSELTQKASEPPRARPWWRMWGRAHRPVG